MSNQANRKNQDTLVLIQEEYRLVLQGKSPNTLVNILQTYELDPALTSIHQQPNTLNIYAYALLIQQQYIPLHLLLRRYKEIQNFQSLLKITISAKAQNLSELTLQTQQLIKKLPEGEGKLKKRIKTSLVQAILKNLSRYYLNISIKQFCTLTKLKQQDVSEIGVIKDGFVQLKQQKKMDDCLQSKLRELVLVAQKMSQFE